MFCGLSKANIKKGDIREQPRAERDDFLNVIAIQSHIEETAKPTSMLIPNMIPIKVATPFPPLNLWKMGKR